MPKFWVEELTIYEVYGKNEDHALQAHLNGLSRCDSVEAREIYEDQTSRKLRERIEKRCACHRWTVGSAPYNADHPADRPRPVLIDVTKEGAS